MTFILGWTPKGGALTSAMALFVPWPNSSIGRLGSSAFALSSAAEPGPGVCRHIVHNISEGGRLCHQMAMAARQIVVTSDKGGHFFRQSHPTALAFFLSSFFTTLFSTRSC